jgi:hypothetical protein
MKIQEMKRAIELAAERKCKSPGIAAVVLTNYNTLRIEPVEEVCRLLGLGESYKHQIRSLMQVPDELNQMGYTITKINK